MMVMVEDVECSKEEQMTNILGCSKINNENTILLYK